MNGDRYYTDKARYKSDGERRIAEFLNSVKIDHVYEPGVLLNDNGYQRIWYPDLGLPRYDVFIEYFGIVNDPIYDDRTRHKLDVYRQNLIEVIPVYPSHLRNDYGRYILDELYRNVSSRMSDLERTIQNYSNQRHPGTSRRSAGYSPRSPRY